MDSDSLPENKMPVIRVPARMRTNSAKEVPGPPRNESSLSDVFSKPATFAALGGRSDISGLIGATGFETSGVSVRVNPSRVALISVRLLP